MSILVPAVAASISGSVCLVLGSKDLDALVISQDEPHDQDGQEVYPVSEDGKGQGRTRRHSEHGQRDLAEPVVGAHIPWGGGNDNAYRGDHEDDEACGPWEMINTHEVKGIENQVDDEPVAGPDDYGKEGDHRVIPAASKGHNSHNEAPDSSFQLFL
jgi:hypothetical protein